MYERFKERPRIGVRVVTADGKLYGVIVSTPHPKEHPDAVFVRWENGVKPRPAGWRMLCPVA